MESRNVSVSPRDEDDNDIRFANCSKALFEWREIRRSPVFHCNRQVTKTANSLIDLHPELAKIR
jgi:hypothetical protein